MKMLKSLLVVCALVAFSQVQAQGKKKPLIDSASGQGYGMAGCGLGSVVFGQKPGFIQIFAGTTNGISGNQTFGISSGTLNCGESGRMAQTEQFIQMNQAAIENDMARGQGETIQALSQLLECQNNNFAQTMKSNYQTAFPAGQASAKQIEVVAHNSCQI